jgi:hypothetical protein
MTTGGDLSVGIAPEILRRLLMEFRGCPLLTGTPPSGAGMGRELHARPVLAIVRWKIAELPTWTASFGDRAVGLMASTMVDWLDCHISRFGASHVFTQHVLDPSPGPSVFEGKPYA